MPIWEGVKPFLASLQMRSTASSLLVLSQVGARRENGMLEPAIPLPGVCIRPIVKVLRSGGVVRSKKFVLLTGVVAPT